MNDHEIERIAAATHELRPDWPVSSLKTLIRKQLGHKPRRDVAVALAWVACEQNSHTPARVLESGPWWRAAAVEGATHAPRHPRPSEACFTCGRVMHEVDLICDRPETRLQALAHRTDATTARKAIR